MATPKKANPQTGGRPTKYDPSYPDDLIAWFNIGAYRELIDQNGKEYLLPNKFPTLAGWCGEKLISRTTLHEWVSVYPEFSNAYSIAKERQEAILVQGAMSGAFNSGFAVFTAKNMMGWRDKQPDEVVEQKPVEIRIVNATGPSDD